MSLGYKSVQVLVFAFAVVQPARGDSMLYRYEGDVLPHDPAAGWAIFAECTPPNCTESLLNGHYTLTWAPESGDAVNYNMFISEIGDPPPPALWVEWRFRSDLPIPLTNPKCDGRMTLQYDWMAGSIYPHGDAVVGLNIDDFVLGLELNEFHTYRFESRNGLDYQFSVDGRVFVDRTGLGPAPSHLLQFGGNGGCPRDKGVGMVNQWDYIRYGSITDGEAIVSAQPPSGFLDPDTHAGLDRFIVTFNEPNFALINEITVVSTGSEAPVITKVWRTIGDDRRVQIVLDRALSLGETTTFTFLTAVDGANVVSYTLSDPIPTMSQWSFVIMTLALLIAGTVLATKRRTVGLSHAM